MFILNTERLVLREFQVNDVDDIYHRVFSDAGAMQFGDGPQTRDWARAWVQTSIANYRKQGFGPYAVLEKSTAEILGYCGLFFFPHIDGRSEVEIGYRFGRSNWGQGYATEAAVAVRNFALNELGLSRLVALIDPANIASIRVAQKLGMQYEKDVMLEGYTHPDHLYVIKLQLKK